MTTSLTAEQVDAIHGQCLGVKNTVQLTYNWPFDLYAKDAGINATLLKRALHSPRRAKALLDDPSLDSADGDRPMFLALHAWVLEGRAAMAARYAECPFKRDERTAAFQAWQHANPFKVALTSRQWQTMHAMHASLVAQGLSPLPSYAGGGRGRGEVTVSYRDPDLGLPCKTRFDYATEDLGVAVDVKAVGVITDLESLARHAYAMLYDLQAAHYHLAQQLAGNAHPEFWFLFVSTAPPHDAVLIRASADFLAHGARRRKEAMAKWAECLDTNCYPAALAAEIEGGVELDPPGFIVNRERLDLDWGSGMFLVDSI